VQVVDFYLFQNGWNNALDFGELLSSGKQFLSALTKRVKQNADF
jgi:hypothetical protein